MSVCWRDGCEGATNATDKAECLVSLGESKKVVQLTGARKEADLRTSLLQGHFANLTCERFLIQVSVSVCFVFTVTPSVQQGPESLMCMFSWCHGEFVVIENVGHGRRDQQGTFGAKYPN